MVVSRFTRFVFLSLVYVVCSDEGCSVSGNVNLSFRSRNKFSFDGIKVVARMNKFSELFICLFFSSAVVAQISVELKATLQVLLTLKDLVSPLLSQIVSQVSSINVQIKGKSISFSDMFIYLKFILISFLFYVT